MAEQLMDNPYSFILITFGIIIIIAGLALKFIPPKKPNWLYGYRTKRSMKGQVEWDYAQQFSSKLSIRYGLSSMAISTAGYFLDLSEKVGLLIAIFWIIVVSILLIYKVEKELKEKFDLPNE